jgi:hypothetical protein
MLFVFSVVKTDFEPQKSQKRKRMMCQNGNCQHLACVIIFGRICRAEINPAKRSTSAYPARFLAGLQCFP